MNTKSEQPVNTKICEKCGNEMEYVEDYISTVFSDMRKKLGVPEEEGSETEEVKYHFECKHCEKLKEQERTRRETQEKKDAYRKKVLKGIPPIYSNCSINDFQNIGPVIEWAKKPAGFLYIYGNTGTGKTHLLCSMKSRYNELDIYSRLFFSSEVFLRIRKSFNNDHGETESDIIEHCSGNFIAFFDDFGSQKMSEYALETWYNIINTRYMGNYPTVFTSNITLKEISSQMSDRIASRLASGVIFELKGDDQRIVNRVKNKEAAERNKINF